MFCPCHYESQPYFKQFDSIFRALNCMTTWIFVGLNFLLFDILKQEIDAITWASWIMS